MRLTGWVRSRTNTTDPINSAKTALHNHRSVNVKPKIPNLNSRIRVANNAKSEAAILRLIAVYLSGSRKMSSSTIDSKIIKVHRGAGRPKKLAPKYLRRGKTTKKPTSTERNKSHTNK